MDVTSFQKKDNRVTFNVKDVDVELLNAFRRTIISNVPVLAIEKVHVEKNNSILNDEILAHRLGLVPLKADLKKLAEMYECKCAGEGCSKCTVKLTLQAAGPKTVYSGELQSDKAQPVYDTMPLVLLNKGQEVKLEAEAVVGRGLEHIKWQAGIASYEVKKSHVEFMIESFGQYSIEDLVKAGLDEYGEKIREVAEKLK
jgi:DNA-directed RNA polymerase subunit D